MAYAMMGGIIVGTMASIGDERPSLSRGAQRMTLDEKIEQARRHVESGRRIVECQR